MQTKINSHGYLTDTTKTRVTELANIISSFEQAESGKTYLMDGCIISSELHFCSSFIKAIILAFDTNRLLDASRAFFPCLHA